MWLQHPNFKERFGSWWRELQGNGWEVANGRRNRKYIKVLENERGLVLNNSKSIKEEILRYFEKLYASPSEESWRVKGLNWSPISGESAPRLESPFTEKEISKATFQLDMDKAPGPDGFTITVFQDCWDVIKEDLVRVFAEFNRSGIINQRRLRGVLHETIHSTQGAFVQARQILDAVLMVNEIVDEKRRSREEGVVFKIDFEKAYNHVSWDFLDHVLEKKGFSPRWRKWMRGCLSSVSFAVLVNGNAKGWVKASRGLRQGNPLSHFLFTLVTNVLSRMLLRAEERNALEGFRVESSLKACGFWDPVIERISRRLDEWQKTYLSFGGRITLIQSCLTHMPCHFLSLFKIPASMAAKIERLQRDFLWSRVGEGKRDHLVSWDVVCNLKAKGGLGFGKISIRNFALLGKWLWRYPREGSALWHQVILSIYGSHSNGWDANTIVKWSHRCPWKAIAQVSQEFSKFTWFVVGDGERIQFWEDFWWGDQPLGVQYPRLLRVVTDKNTLISSILGSTRPFSWNFNFRRNLSDSDIEDLECLMRSLDRLHLSHLVPDMRSWSLSPSGFFTVKYFFLALSQFSSLPLVFPTKLVSNSQVSFKVKSFVWLVVHKKVNTNDLLQLRRPYKTLSPDIFSKDGLGYPKEHL
ncbi:putative ribonuclease H protein [Vitis vinifera]|uniref:Putative ribonuclease H protein n=1 Tax=Vitis vinifera TaxID=29760 RepID=A0A438J9N3_VITVI|nr:putative ribonuclease H protein [Vitis vinifera]